MLKGLRVENFKSLREVEVKFGDFTVLVGENNSGKSALLESIKYLHEAEGAAFASQVTNPPYVSYPFDEPDNLFFTDGTNQADFVRVIAKIEASGLDSYDEFRELAREYGSSSEIRYGSSSVTSEFHSGAKLSEGGWEPVYQFQEGDERVDLLSVGERIGRRQGQPVYELETPFELGGNGAMRGVFNISGLNNDALDRWVSALREMILEELRSVYYITDNRDIDQWSADPRQQEFVGHSGGDTVSMLHALRDDEEVFNRIADAIRDISPDVAELRANMYGTHTRTELMDEDTEALFNIVASGAGLRRLLPIIVQISAAEEGDTVMVEEPEISVYPKTQERLVEFMLDSIENRDIQIIVSTHGIPFTWKIQNMADRDVGHALQFEKEGGETSVTQHPLDRIPVQDYYGEE